MAQSVEEAEQRKAKKRLQSQQKRDDAKRKKIANVERFTKLYIDKMQEKNR